MPRRLATARSTNDAEGMAAPTFAVVTLFLVRHFLFAFFFAFRFHAASPFPFSTRRTAPLVLQFVCMQHPSYLQFSERRPPRVSAVRLRKSTARYAFRNYPLWIDTRLSLSVLLSLL